MISPNRTSRVRTWRSLSSVFIVCIMVGVVAVWRGPIASVLWRVLEPVVVWRNSLDTSEASALRSRLASTTLLIADRQALYEENLQLKSLLGRTLPTHALVAGVIARPPDTPYDTIMIDAGSTDGVAPGDLVYGAGSSMIGTIKEVYAKEARAVLFSSPGSEYHALLRGTIPITLVGQGAGSMSSEIPSGVDAAVGQSVVAQGIGGGFLGSVSFVAKDEGTSFKTLYVQLPENIFSLRFVLVRPPL